MKKILSDNLENVLRGDPYDPLAFSGLSKENAETVYQKLAEKGEEKLNAFFREIKEFNDEESEGDFDSLAKIGMSHTSESIRGNSVWLMRFSENKTAAREILRLAEEDPSEFVQEKAVRVLGFYNDLAEMDERIPLSPETVFSKLCSFLNFEKRSLRYAALEGLAFSNLPELKPIIESYLNGDDKEEQISALHAIANSLDESKEKRVLELLMDDDADIRLEAVRVTGVLQTRKALPMLYSLLSHYDTLSEPLRNEIIWSISEIGDEDSMDVLQLLSEISVEDDYEFSEFVDDALENLEMSIGIKEMIPEPAPKDSASFKKALERARDQCLSALEEKLPYDFDDEDNEEDEDECECGEHHHHHHENPFRDLDPSRFRIIDDLEEYENHASDDESDENDPDIPL